MKKIALIIGVLCCAYNGFAQDTIATHDGKFIQAKILELTNEKVSYKKYDYQDGATIVLDLDKVKSISWANGDVDEFVKKENVQTTDDERDYYDKTPVENTEDQLPYLIEKNYHKFYFANGDILDVFEFKAFLLRHDLNYIWTQYNSGDNQLATGAFLVLFGSFAEIGGFFVNKISKADNAPLMAGALFVGGGILELAGIICMIVGGSKMATAINSYQDLSRKRPSYSYNTTLKIGATSNGIGFTLNF